MLNEPQHRQKKKSLDPSLLITTIKYFLSQKNPGAPRRRTSSRPRCARTRGPPARPSGGGTAPVGTSGRPEARPSTLETDRTIRRVATHGT